jgi:hypothetical protein
VSSIEALVVEQPCVGVLDDGADAAEAGAVPGTDLADPGLDALAQAEPAIVRAVIAGIGEKTGDPGADHQSEAQQFGEHPGVVDVGGRGDRAQWQSVARDDDVILGAALAPVGFGPVNSPPCLARTLQLSTITSNSRAAVSGSDRAMRSSTAWTRGSTAVSRQSRNRRRRVEPDARPAAAGSSRHWTPSRRKNRKVSTTSATGRRGRPRSAGSPSSRSMISATRLLAVTLKVHSNAIQRPYMAARHLDLHNGQHGCYVQTLDLPIIGNRL